jgi:uncharacterized membrane protein
MGNLTSFTQKPTLLLASLALNIFMVAFFLGGTIPPVGMMPPPFMHDEHFIPRHGFGAESHMPPPPFFGPEALFSPEEMQQNFSAMQESFKNGRQLREEFATLLKKEKVTKADVLKHFAAMDQAMDKVKKQMQGKVAEKISSMSQKERQEFAANLLQKAP